jgi:hypothetical protein
MNFTKTSTVIVFALFLVACDRNDYVTWKCEPSPSGKTFSFILEGSKMKLNNQLLSFCGSMGPNSYFDQPCPAQATDSKVNLNPKLGILLFENEQFQCNAL